MMVESKRGGDSDASRARKLVTSYISNIWNRLALYLRIHYMFVQTFVLLLEIIQTLPLSLKVIVIHYEY